MFARTAALAISLLLAQGASPAPFQLPAGEPIPQLTAACHNRNGWTDPAPPVKIYANVYYVGTCGITSLLIVSRYGHILLDAGPKDAAPLIAANIRTLGLRPEDVKWIVTSHEHHDHVGGVAELRRMTGAGLAANPDAKTALEQGRVGEGDPQAASAEPWPAAPVNRVMRDGEHLRLGPLDLTLHTTPGHTPNSTSWTWRACEGQSCRSMAYIDSVTSVSSEQYRFSEHAAYVEAFRRSLRKVAGLPCDILITPHPGASAFLDRLAGNGPLIDPQACVRYAEAGRGALEKRLKDEAASP